MARIIQMFKRFIFDKKIRFNYLSKVGVYNALDDKKYLCKKYALFTGEELDLDNPVGFNEKIQWLKIYDRNPIYTTMVDKCRAKKYVGDIIGYEHVIPMIGSWEKAEQVRFESLPNKFVLKCNHNSGTGMFICKDKTLIDEDAVIKELRKGIRENSYYASREWPCKNVERKIFAEQYMEEKGTDCLIDYKFYCFNGEPKFLYVALANFIDGRKNDQLSYFDLNWNPTPFYRTDHQPFPYKIEKPEKLQEMIEIAAVLSKGIPFVRVDLFCINNQIYFSEFTFSPGGGFGLFLPHEWEIELGKWIELPE